MIDSLLYAGLAAGCFGIAMVLMKFGLEKMHPMAGALISIPTTTVIFWCLAPFTLGSVDWSSPALGIFVIVGFFYPAMVTLLIYEANLRLGPTYTATISSVTPLFAIIGAILFLDESLTLLILIGTLGIVAGLMMISWNRSHQQESWSKFIILLPLGGAFIRGGAQMLTKMGLEILPAPFLAGLIGYTTSVFSILLIYHIRFGLGRFTFDVSSLKWFMLVGVANGSAVLFLYMALKTGKVVAVAPVVATFPLFTLLFSRLFFRHEKVAARIVAGVVLVVSGVVLVCI